MSVFRPQPGRGGGRDTNTFLFPPITRGRWECQKNRTGGETKVTTYLCEPNEPPELPTEGNTQPPARVDIFNALSRPLAKPEPSSNRA